MNTVTTARSIHREVPARPSRLVPTVVAIVIGVVILGAAARLSIPWGDLGSLPGQVVHYLVLMFASPDWEMLPQALFETWRSISMAWIGAIGCVLVSIPLGMIAARNVGPVWARLPLRGLFAVIRAVPEVIIALLLLTVTGLTPFTGALALAIAGIGTHAKWVYETIESVQEGASEAVRAAGGSTAEVTRWALWPAAAPQLLSFALYRFEINIRTSAVLGLVGAGGIGSMLANYTNFRQWGTVGMLLIVVVLATMLMDAVSGSIRRRIMGGPRMKTIVTPRKEPADVAGVS